MNTFLFISLRWLDALDIVLVALFLSYFYTLVRGTVAMRILIGLLFILISWKITLALQMELVADLIGTFIGIGSIAFVIIFQPELRKFLIRLGSNKLAFDINEKGWLKFRKDNAGLSPIIQEVVNSVESMSSTKTGAIIVLDVDSDLEKIAASGVQIDAKVSSELIYSIFYKNNPLHDGAMVITEDRIVSAGCILPNSDRDDLPKSFGLRHRAAIGLSEQSNAFIILVSEETGKILTSHNNNYDKNVKINELREQLISVY